MSEPLNSDQVARVNQDKINALINKCIVDASQRQMLQVIAKSVWVLAFEAGLMKGLEAIDPHRASVDADAVLGRLKERADLARDGALMREAVRVMSEMIKVLSPAQVAALGLSLHEPEPEPEPRSRPALRVAASHGRLVLEANGRK